MVDSDDVDVDVKTWTPVDVNEYDDSYAIVIDMPGVKAGDVRVQVKANNVLFISSEQRRVEEEGAKCLKMERHMRKSMRKFALPETANTDKITVVSTDGVVTVTVEKLPQAVVVSCGDDQRQSKVLHEVDRISQLPNELLVQVLSLLSLKEATATSILSRGWRYLHSFTTKLDLDYCKNFKYIELWEEQLRKCIEWVDGIIGSKKSSHLEEFRLFLPLFRLHAQHIDEWVRFALSRRVESLVLQLLCFGDNDIGKENHYTLNLHTLMPQMQYYNLRRLCTWSLNVSGEGVEMLLRNCPLLEEVSVSCSAHLVCLNILKPYPSFKKLEINLCWDLSWVVVRDSNIESVKYSGHTVKWVLVNVPHLTQIFVGGICTHLAEDVVQMFSSVLPQLHMFKILFSSMNFAYIHNFCSRFGSGVVMTSLKQLVVNIHYFMEVHHEEDLLALIDLMRVSPRLQRFVIEETYERGYNLVDNFVELDRKIPMVYPHLKEVEFVGYRGVSNHIQILKHLVENAIALETILVHPRNFKLYYWQAWDPIPHRKFDQEMFARAEVLKSCVPFGINVKILH